MRTPEQQQLWLEEQKEKSRAKFQKSSAEAEAIAGEEALDRKSQESRQKQSNDAWKAKINSSNKDAEAAMRKAWLEKTKASAHAKYEQQIAAVDEAQLERLAAAEGLVAAEATLVQTE